MILKRAMSADGTELEVVSEGRVLRSESLVSVRDSFPG